MHSSRCLESGRLDLEESRGAAGHLVLEIVVSFVPAIFAGMRTETGVSIIRTLYGVFEKEFSEIRESL